MKCRNERCVFCQHRECSLYEVELDETGSCEEYSFGSSTGFDFNLDDVPEPEEKYPNFFPLK